MVRVGMRNEHDADGRSPEVPVDRRQVVLVIWTGIDDRHHRSGVDDPGVGARSRIRARIRGNDPRNGRQREG
jgi:hypothetical protein